jgi:glycosyltransferase involved in cell wall biosynthesis
LRSIEAPVEAWEVAVRIGIDACCWQNPRGFGRFTRELIRQLVESYGHRHEFVLIADQVTVADSQFPEPAIVDSVKTSKQPISAAAAEGWRSPFDLVRLFFASLRARLFWKAKILLARHQATTIVTPSESARASVASALRWPADTIRRIDEAAAGIFSTSVDDESIQRVLQQYELPTEVPLLLYVGGISPHKNLAGLLEAMAQVFPDDPHSWHLTLVGEHERDSYLGCYGEICALVRRLDLTDRITFTGFVPDEDLAALYSAATALVLPSFDEGFGLPVVEAMSRGLPVAVSRRGSLPEVVGDAGLLFDPDDRSEIANAIVRLLTDDDLRTKLSEQGLERASRFSWKKAAGQMIDILEDVASR